jgi:hypothetical protein
MNAQVMNERASLWRENCFSQRPEFSAPTPTRTPTLNLAMNATTQCVEAKLLLQYDLEPGTFAADWRHCDRIANYLAGLASFDRVDSFLYANLLSTVLNELFEIVFCQHTPSDRVACTISRNDNLDRIELQIPVGESERRFYRQSVAAAQAPEVVDVYTKSLLGGTPDGTVGFLELAADYGAKIRIEEPAGSGSLHLIVDVSLEGNRFASAVTTP